jgi:zinc finger protein
MYSLEVTTVEGILRRTISGLEQDQPVRREREPEDAAQIDTFIKRIEDLLNLNQPFHIVSK